MSDFDGRAIAKAPTPSHVQVTLDFLEVHGLRDAVSDVHAAGKRVVVATPRVLKPDEQRLWRFYLGLRADALLLRSAGLLQQLLSLGGPGAAVPDTALVVPELMGDFSLNVANSISARTFLAASVTRLAPTHDLSVLQLQGLADALAPAERPGWRSSHTITCPSSTQSIASFAASCPTATRIRTAVTRARQRAYISGTRKVRTTSCLRIWDAATQCSTRSRNQGRCEYLSC